MGGVAGTASWRELNDEVVERGGPVVCGVARAANWRELNDEVVVKGGPVVGGVAGTPS